MNGFWEMIERMMHFCITKILHIKLKPEQWKALMQFIKFGVVGLSNTVISYVVYVIMLNLGAHYLVASVTGFVVSVINAFYWNNRYVFAAAEGEKRSLLGNFCKCFLSYAGTGLVLNNILLILQVQVLGWPESIAPLINLVVTIPLNFILNKLWAFRSA